MRIAYFQMDKHSSIALHDLHIFPTKNQIIVTLLLGPISYSWIWQTFFLSFQLLLPTSGGSPVSHKPVQVHPDPTCRRSKGPIYSKERRNLALEATSAQICQKSSLMGVYFLFCQWEEKKQTKRTHLKDGKFCKLLLGEFGMDFCLLLLTFGCWHQILLIVDIKGTRFRQVVIASTGPVILDTFCPCFAKVSKFVQAASRQSVPTIPTSSWDLALLASD